MTDNESRLLRAILESPGDDTPRKAIADYYYDTGDTVRAAFILDQLAGEYTEPPPDADWPYEVGQLLYGPDAVRLCDFGYGGGKGPHSWTWNRGFVATVHAPLAVLVGGECGTCGGQRVVPRPRPVLSWPGGQMNMNDDCPACHGTGRVPGVWRELFERQPVTRIETDRVPCTHRVLGRIRWAFWRSLPNITPESRVPWQLLEHLDTGYESEAAARDALSDALVAHFREQAGLPPLEVQGE